MARRVCSREYGDLLNSLLSRQAGSAAPHSRRHAIPPRIPVFHRIPAAIVRSSGGRRLLLRKSRIQARMSAWVARMHRRRLRPLPPTGASRPQGTAGWKRNRAESARNPLKTLISVEKIQGNPNSQNPRFRGAGASPCGRPGRIQIEVVSRRRMSRVALRRRGDSDDSRRVRSRGRNCPGRQGLHPPPTPSRAQTQGRHRERSVAIQGPQVRSSSPGSPRRFAARDDGIVKRPRRELHSPGNSGTGR